MYVSLQSRMHAGRPSLNVSVARDQEVNVATQLELGVRLLQAQSHM